MSLEHGLEGLEDFRYTDRSDTYYYYNPQSEEIFLAGKVILNLGYRLPRDYRQNNDPNLHEWTALSIRDANWLLNMHKMMIAGDWLSDAKAQTYSMHF